VPAEPAEPAVPAVVAEPAIPAIPVVAADPALPPAATPVLDATLVDALPPAPLVEAPLTSWGFPVCSLLPAGTEEPPVVVDAAVPAPPAGVTGAEPVALETTPLNAGGPDVASSELHARRTPKGSKKRDSEERKGTRIN
jgi:hypothetical protein